MQTKTLVLINSKNHLKIPQPSSELSKNKKLLKVVFLLAGNQLLIHI